MQLSERNNKYRKEFGEICPIEEDPHFYYANFFLQCAPEYNKLIELHKEDFLGRIVGALQAYDFKSLANAEDKEKVNVTLKTMEFTQSLFKPQDLNAENVDAVMRLCAIGFYIWFRVAVENPTDLDIMMFFQAKDEDVHTNMTYSLDANTDWGKKQGYSYMDIETYFALYNTDIPKKQSFEYLRSVCIGFAEVCNFNEEMLKFPDTAPMVTSKEFIRSNRKWCIYLLIFAKGLWGMVDKDVAMELVNDLGKLAVYARKVFRGYRERMQDDFKQEYTCPDRDMLYERFFISCFIHVAVKEKIIDNLDSHEGLGDFMKTFNPKD